MHAVGLRSRRCLVMARQATEEVAITWYRLGHSTMSRQHFLCGQIPGYITRARVAELTPPQGPTIVGMGNGTPEVPELPNVWG
jgi:hypothetical protein